MLFEFTAPALPGPIRLNLRPESAAVALGADQVLSFDGAGRLLTAFRDGRLYKRGLDQRIMEKWRPWTVGRPDHVRRDLADDEKLRLVAAAGHIADTLDVVNSLGLDDGDILYFSEFVDAPGSEYATHAQAAGVRALASPAVRAQAMAIRAGLRFERAPRLATYDIREFIY